MKIKDVIKKHMVVLAEEPDDDLIMYEPKKGTKLILNSGDGEVDLVSFIDVVGEDDVTILLHDGDVMIEELSLEDDRDFEVFTKVG